ncbi:GAP family protein [Gulosibacter hominis]|uniref:GAP family protein n=1 Tax=Gulosibacter hominis TaxID=2770504 RepID=UPI00191996B0|nr:GAP family protein [Gulosibacter hominis]
MLDIIPLIGLALVDSLSVGTLVIPLTLLLRWGHLRTIPYATYLCTITVAYFALGITLMLGFAGIGSIITEATQTDWFPWVTLVLGAALAVFGIFAPNPKKPEPGETNVPTDTTKMQKATRAGLAGMVSLALGAAVIEAATMLPYLAAIGIMQSFEITPLLRLALLAAYCIIMVLPAMLAGGAMGLVGDRLADRLQRWIPRLNYEAKVTLLWIAAIVGITMVYRSANALNLW